MIYVVTKEVRRPGNVNDLIGKSAIEADAKTLDLQERKK